MLYTIKLETSNLMLEFDKTTGSLIKLYSKVSNWYVLNKPRLGLSFRMMIPIKDKRNNDVYGNTQKSPTCEYGDKFVKFTWNTVESKFGGTHDIKVSTVCEIVDDQAVFKMNIKNNSSEFVENVYYPYLGDLHQPDACEFFKFMHGGYNTLLEYSLWPTFTNTRGYYGSDFPIIVPQKSADQPPMYPFALFEDNNGNGFYIGLTQQRIETTSWHIELRPGYEEAMSEMVPSHSSIAEKETHFQFAVGHMPFVAPGMEFDLLSFGMQAYKGNWYDGASCYTKMSDKWSSFPTDFPNWVTEPHSWLQLQINSPEDELRTKYKDLLAVGEECAKKGIRAIQLVGWNNGGQDRGNPYHDIDTRLGTWDELKDAIAKIQGMGVKIILFSKFVWADRSNDDFKERFEPLSVKDPYGDYYLYDGYMYNTLSQLTHINTRRLIPMCFSSKEYMDICVHEFKKCVDLGADGILYDESQHHSPTLCCFDTSHGHRYGEPTYSKDRELIANFRKVLDGKEFLICGEGLYDFQHDFYNLSYTRTWNCRQNTAKFGSKHMALSRYLRPRGQIMTAITGFNDRNMVNQCLLDRYIISYEPFNFKGKLADFPQTVEYGNKMDKLRTDLREYFWDGTFNGDKGAKVTCDGIANFKDYSVFKTNSCKFGVIICNYDLEKAIKVTVESTCGQNFTKYRLVDNNSLIAFNEAIEIPPRSAVAVI